MYYDNKSTFYVRQYGPKVMLVVFSIVLICSGLYIYYGSVKDTLTKNPKTEMVANNNTEEKKVITENSDNSKEIVTDSLKEIVNKEEVSTKLDEKLNSLEPLEKSELGLVQSVTKDGKVIIKIGDISYQITLIGIDYSKSASDIADKINADLKDKQVNIAFDKLKVKDSNIYAYIYINNELYNKELLKNGLAILKVERTNTSLLDELLQAQLYARSNSLGIWKN